MSSRRAESNRCFLFQRIANRNSTLASEFICLYSTYCTLPSVEYMAHSAIRIPPGYAKPEDLAIFMLRWFAAMAIIASDGMPLLSASS